MSAPNSNGHLFIGPPGCTRFCVGCAHSPAEPEGCQRCPCAAALAPFTGFPIAPAVWPTQVALPKHAEGTA